MSAQLYLFDALDKMKGLSDAGVPFSITFFTKDGELKEVKRAFIRHGLTSKQSDRSKYLIAYTDVDTNQHRHIHRALLMKVNQIQIVR